MMAGTRAISRPLTLHPPRLRLASSQAAAALALLAPSGLFLALFTYWPVAQVLTGSLQQQGFRGASTWGFGNDARLFADPQFRVAVINTAFYAAGTIIPGAAGTIIPGLALALLFALALRETTGLTGLLRTLVALPKGNSPAREAAAWTMMNWLVSPEVTGRWSRFTGYFAPRIAAYDLPEMKRFIAAHPDAKVALDQLVYARGWFSTYNTVSVRKALEDGVQAVLSGKTTPEAAMAKAQQEADALLRPYVEQTALKVPE